MRLKRLLLIIFICTIASLLMTSCGKKQEGAGHTYSITSICKGRHKKADTKSRAYCRPKRVILYEWGLSTAGTTVDFSSRHLRTYYPTVRNEEAGCRKYNHIRANLSQKDITPIETLIETSNLRNFCPKGSDIKKRLPNVDECPPTLVVIWSDKTKVFNLPLSFTVRRDIPLARRHSYRAMSRICELLRQTNLRYEKEPNLAMISKIRMYQAYERERDRY